jgi:hypothetical protein
MGVASILRLLTPLIIIGLGIWLKITKTEEASIVKIKKYWWVFIIIGIINFSLKMYTFIV